MQWLDRPDGSCLLGLSFHCRPTPDVMSCLENLVRAWAESEGGRATGMGAARGWWRCTLKRGAVKAGRAAGRDLAARGDLRGPPDEDR